jgi:hypothetical protein
MAIPLSLPLLPWEEQAAVEGKWEGLELMVAAGTRRGLLLQRG